MRGSMEGYRASTIVRNIVADPNCISESQDYNTAMGVIVTALIESESDININSLLPAARQADGPVRRLLVALAEQGLYELPQDLRPNINQSASQVAVSVPDAAVDDPDPELTAAIQLSMAGRPASRAVGPEEQPSQIIYQGKLNNHGYQGMLDALHADNNRLVRFFRTTPPFANDEVFTHYLDTLLGVHSDGVIVESTYDQKIDAFIMLNFYFTFLQSATQAVPFSAFPESNPKQTLATPVLESLLLTQEDPYNVRLNESYGKLINDKKLPFIQKIRGDGNCYFRALIQGQIEHALLSDDRKTTLDHIANLIELNVLGGGLFNEDHPGGQERGDIVALVAKLRAAADGQAWQNLQAFHQDMNDPAQDKAMIMALRYITAQYVMDSKDDLFNGLSLTDATLPSFPDCTTMDEYRKAYITKMGVCAEGAFVDTGLLPQLLGIRAPIHIMHREQPFNTVDAVERQLSENFRQEYKRRYGHPVPPEYGEVNLQFLPGHYNRAMTAEENQARVLHLETQTPAFVAPLNASAAAVQISPVVASAVRTFAAVSAAPAPAPKAAASNISASVNHSAEEARKIQEEKAIREQLERQDKLVQAYENSIKDTPASSSLNSVAPARKTPEAVSASVPGHNQSVAGGGKAAMVTSEPLVLQQLLDSESFRQPLTQERVGVWLDAILAVGISDAEYGHTYLKDNKLQVINQLVHFTQDGNSAIKVQIDEFINENRQLGLESLNSVFTGFSATLEQLAQIRADSDVRAHPIASAVLALDENNRDFERQLADCLDYILAVATSGGELLKEEEQNLIDRLIELSLQNPKATERMGAFTQEQAPIYSFIEKLIKGFNKQIRKLLRGEADPYVIPVPNQSASASVTYPKNAAAAARRAALTQGVRDIRQEAARSIDAEKSNTKRKK